MLVDATNDVENKFNVATKTMSNYFFNDSFNFIGTYTANQSNASGVNDTANNFININNNHVIITNSVRKDSTKVSNNLSSSSSSAAAAAARAATKSIGAYGNSVVSDMIISNGSINSDFGLIVTNTTTTLTGMYDNNNFTTSITELPNSTTTEFNSKISLSTVIPLTIIYLIIFISGVLGNVITCIVISRNKSMHTATNYYLFSLAISDLLVLIAGK